MPKRWSDDEIKLIKDMFKNTEFITAVRDVMMGFKEEFDFKTTDETIAILKKNLLPSFQAEVPGNATRPYAAFT